MFSKRYTEELHARLTHSFLNREIIDELYYQRGFTREDVKNMMNKIGITLTDLCLELAASPKLAAPIQLGWTLKYLSISPTEWRSDNINKEAIFSYLREQVLHLKLTPFKDKQLLNKQLVELCSPIKTTPTSSPVSENEIARSRMRV